MVEGRSGRELWWGSFTNEPFFFLLPVSLATTSPGGKRRVVSSTGIAWLSSVRVVRCVVQSSNEQNLCERCEHGTPRASRGPGAEGACLSVDVTVDGEPLEACLLVFVSQSLLDKGSERRRCQVRMVLIVWARVVLQCLRQREAMV